MPRTLAELEADFLKLERRVVQLEIRLNRVPPQAESLATIAQALGPLGEYSRQILAVQAGGLGVQP
jgi:hypothetical protein